MKQLMLPMIEIAFNKIILSYPLACQPVRRPVRGPVRRNEVQAETKCRRKRSAGGSEAAGINAFVGLLIIDSDSHPTASQFRFNMNIETDLKSRGMTSSRVITKININESSSRIGKKFKKIGWNFRGHFINNKCLVYVRQSTKKGLTRLLNSHILLTSWRRNRVYIDRCLRSTLAQYAGETCRAKKSLRILQKNKG